ncbi:MAG: aspartate aminotransferase family protein [Bacteroidetes bacterium]|jgi:glutamate/tyrosine decarboxylase-like PLP-dependent enzyme|nr:aspartate aminotransferase family protein [Bacteroidota bacterium]
MKTIWKKYSEEEIKNRIFSALKRNVNYQKQQILGLPASYLDEKVFHQDASFLKDAPYMSTMVQNPNHIGCHTLGTSEPFFRGTQEIERELIELVAVDILRGKQGEHDGYIASGGTEANMQAIWIYRNYFKRKFGAENREISILCSADNHYSMDKAANVLAVKIHKTSVDDENRSIKENALRTTLQHAWDAGIRYIVAVPTMMTTMFGSVDDIDLLVNTLEDFDFTFTIHVDGAYGGFYYPFSNPDNPLSFAHPKVSSITLDAHKMAQAPYGTGIFVIRKNWMHYANTREASYVAGEDCTLIGSRSGANAISIWMILMKYGPYGWQEKIFILQKRTDWICKQLDELKIGYYRHPLSNIVTMRAQHIPDKIADEFGLIPDHHKAPKWYKIVVMEHVTIEKVFPLMEQLKILQNKSALK